MNEVPRPSEMLAKKEKERKESEKLAKEEKERREKVRAVNGMGTPLSNAGSSPSWSSSPGGAGLPPSPTDTASDDEGGSPILGSGSPYSRSFAAELQAKNEARKFEEQRKRAKESQARPRTNPFKSSLPIG